MCLRFHFQAHEITLQQLEAGSEAETKRHRAERNYDDAHGALPKQSLASLPHSGNDCLDRTDDDHRFPQLLTLYCRQPHS